MTFPEWCITICLEHGFGRFIAQKTWNARSAIADAREAELRAEIAAKDAEIERLRAELSESQRWVTKYEAQQSAESMMVLVEHDEHDRLLALDEENKRLRAENQRLRDFLTEQLCEESYDEYLRRSMNQ